MVRDRNAAVKAERARVLEIREMAAAESTVR